MRGRHLLSPEAQEDLERIWDYTVKHWGIDQAEAYTRQLWRAVETIAAHPAHGRACAEIRAGYYKFRTGSHFLFYRLTDGVIDVVRIMHERMDFERHL